MTDTPLSLRSIKVTTNAGRSVTMELRRPELSGFLIRNITGLTPGAVEVQATELTTIPGSIISGTKKTTRNIVFDLTLLWASTVEEMRHNTELYFPIGEEIRMDFYTHDRSVFIRGTVEANDPVIFDNGNQGNGIDCQISVICSDPRFYTQTNNQKEVYTNHLKGFHMPFGIRKLSPTVAPVPVGVIKDNDKYYYLIYNGTAVDGLTFKIYFNNTARDITIQSLNDSKKMIITPLEKFQKGDVLYISTKSGNHYIRMLRNNAYYNYLNYYHFDESDWIQLHPGENTFLLEVDGGGSNSSVEIVASWRDAFWGI